MAHHSARHTFQKGQLVGGYAIPRLLVQNTVGANAVPARRSNWHAGIEARVGRASYEGKVAEAVVFGEVVYDQRRKVTRIVEGQDAVLWGQVDGVVTEALLFGENGGAKT
jgi:hypothetical protein